MKPRAGRGARLDHRRIARQQWRARIETSRILATMKTIPSIARQQWRARIETRSPRVRRSRCRQGIARQQWRARIETRHHRHRHHRPGASPASNGGRGLKRYALKRHGLVGLASPASNGGRGLKREGGLRCGPKPHRIARQQWRARIETAMCAPRKWCHQASPASNGGRGLKHAEVLRANARCRRHRPPAMAGAD